MHSIRRWVLATFILTFLVIIAGGVVRTTQSGMGCPDWPRCFGRWIPPTDISQLPPDYEKYLRKQDIDHTFNALHTWIEYINRLTGALLGVFAIIQVALLFSKRKIHRRSYNLALFFLLIVILTGLFGAVVVKLNLAHLSISVHLLFAIVLVQIQLALLLSIHNKLFALPVNKNIKTIVYLFLLLLLIQSVLGTMVRMYIDDISKALDYERRDTWLLAGPVNFLLHRSFSWVVLVFSIVVCWYGSKAPSVKRMTFALGGWVLLNMIVGIILYYAGMPAFAQPVHLLLATAVITQTMSILLQTRQAGTDLT
ncbi:MAG TPA: COX15/CtaA family protein [Chitinophagaceae bacterium]|nr:COX15/CtaA family protein [Chitinophagaceae bacterium]